MKKYFGTACQAEGIARACLAMGNRHDTTAVLREATVPVLFIIGKEDKAIPFYAAMTLTHLPDTADIFILPAAGHMGMLEAPVECQQEILWWIELCGF